MHPPCLAGHRAGAGAFLPLRVYAAQHFAIATDIKELFPRDLPWTQRAYQYLDAFPEQGMLVVVDAPTPELVEQAAAKLTAALAADREHFQSVQALQGGEFFARNALLYLPPDQVAGIAGSMDQAGSLIGSLERRSEPQGRARRAELRADRRRQRRLFARRAGPADDHGSRTRWTNRWPAGRRISRGANWRAASRPNPAICAASSRRSRCSTSARSNRAAPRPRRSRQAAQRLNLAGDYQARVRLTGLVPMNDAQFAR